MSKDTKTFETLGFAMFPAFVIYDWIYDPNESGFLFLTMIALILWWLYSMFTFVLLNMGENAKEASTNSFYLPLALLNVLAVLAAIGFYVLSEIGRVLNAL